MTALLFYVACSHGRRSTRTPDGAEGISSTSLSDRDKKYESSDNKCRTSGFLRPSVSHFLSAKHELTGTLNIGNLGKTDGGTIRDGLKLLQWAAGGGKIWTAGPPSGYSSRKWDISEPPTFPGFSANYLMWRKAVLKWKMTTDHPVKKLGTKVMKSLDWTVQAFVDARMSTEALLQPDAMESILRVLDAKARSRKTSPNSSCERHCSA